MTDEAEALDQLIRSSGWALFKQGITTHWLDQFDNQVATATNDSNDLQALGKLRQIIAAKHAVELMLTWPEHRLKQLAEKTANATRQQAIQRGGL